MQSSLHDLAAYVRTRSQEILLRWEADARSLEGVGAMPSALLRDELVQVLSLVADAIEGPEPKDLGPVRAHVVQRIGLGMALPSVVAELQLLRRAIEHGWAENGGDWPCAALDALGRGFDRVVVSTIERYGELRSGLLASVDAIVRDYPAIPVDEALLRILQALVRGVEDVSAAAIEVREGDRLRTLADVGSEHRIASSQRFAGLVAAERAPRTVRVDALDASARNGWLHGVPLLHGGELLGVAHLHCEVEPSDEVTGLFRVVMDRVAGLLQQEALRGRIDAERARYRAVVDNAPPIIFSKDLQGRYVTMNRSAVVKLGLRPEDFIGRTDLEMFPPHIAEPLRAQDRQVMDTGQPSETEERVSGPSGERFFLTVKFPIVDADGRVISVGGVATDITERRRWRLGRELLAEVGRTLASSELDVDATVAAIARCALPALADCCVVELLEFDDRPGRVLIRHCDPRREAVLRGRDAGSGAHPVLGDAALIREPLLVPEVTDESLDSLAIGPGQRDALRDLGPTSLILVPLYARGHPLGTWVFLRCGGERYDAIDAEVARELGWRASFTLDNARLYALAQQAVRDRDEMLGVVAHDLRNALSKVMLKSRIAAHPHAGPEAAGAVVRSVGQMKRLVSDLLDRYAIQRGRLTVALHSLPAAELIRAAVDEQRAACDDAGIRLDLVDPGDLPDVLADEERLGQVFANLVGNAVKFTPAGGRIVVGARRVEREVLFFVSDTGPGFPAEALSHLFDRFWKEQRADRRGTGLGLEICKGIVEAHGGRVWAESGPASGATVWFALPAVDPAEGSVGVDGVRPT